MISGEEREEEREREERQEEGGRKGGREGEGGGEAGGRRERWRKKQDLQCEENIKQTKPQHEKTM